MKMAMAPTGEFLSILHTPKFLSPALLFCHWDLSLECCNVPFREFSAKVEEK